MFFCNSYPMDEILSRIAQGRGNGIARCSSALLSLELDMSDAPITGLTVPTQYWHALDNGRVQCDVCPRFCKLLEGQRGLCFVRARQDDRIVLTTWGRSSGF